MSFCFSHACFLHRFLSSVTWKICHVLLVGLLFCPLFFPPVAKRACFPHRSQLVAPFCVYKTSAKTLKLKEYWFNAKNRIIHISRWWINKLLLSPHFLVLLIYLEFDTDYCSFISSFNYISYNDFLSSFCLRHHIYTSLLWSYYWSIFHKSYHIFPEVESWFYLFF